MENFNEIETKTINMLVEIIDRELEKEGLGVDPGTIEAGIYDNWIIEGRGMKEFRDLNVKEIASMAQSTFEELLKEFQ